MEYYLRTSLGTLHLCLARAGIRRRDFVEGANRGGPKLQDLLDELAQDGPIALLPQGTDFQSAVWAEMWKVPHGGTVTYGGLAARLGSPRSAQAVGGAVGANPIAILLPCHRVLPAGGGFGGFRWGVGRKQRFLEWEAEGGDVLEELCGVRTDAFRFSLELDAPPIYEPNAV